MARKAKSRVTGNPFFEESQSSRQNVQSATVVEDNAPAPKDKKEIELEKLLFGDEAGFHDELLKYDDDIDEAFRSDEESGESDREGAEDLEGVDDNDLFFLDAGPATTSNQLSITEAKADTAEDEEPPAWVDSDDERMAVSIASQPRMRKLRTSEGEDVISGREYMRRLQQQFERLYPVPEWANPEQSAHRKKRRRTSNSGSSADEMDSDNMSVDDDDLSAQPLAQFLKSAEPLTSSGAIEGGRRKLRPEVIDVQRTKDVPVPHVTAAITSLQFHPSHPILLSSGPSSLITLHHISPSASSPNPVLTTLAIPHLHLQKAAIHSSGSQVYLAARRRFFHIWDMATGKVARVTRVIGHADEQRTCERFELSPCGRYMALIGSGKKTGIVNVIDAKTGQWVCQARVEGRGGVADLAWWCNGEGMVVLGKGGEAVEYSVSQQKVIARWIDEGAIGTTVVSLGGRLGGGRDNGFGGDKWVAVGSSSGVVNIYDRSQWLPDTVPERPSPKKALQQLVTPTSHLAFSPDGQLLVMASRWKRDALRLVHLPSCTVYRNWPTSGTPFGRITSVAWGGSGGWLAVGNENGKVRLWEIRG